LLERRLTEVKAELIVAAIHHLHHHRAGRPIGSRQAKERAQPMPVARSEATMLGIVRLAVGHNFTGEQGMAIGRIQPLGARDSLPQRDRIHAGREGQPIENEWSSRQRAYLERFPEGEPPPRLAAPARAAAMTPP
jgi:hypothetical protein